MGVAMRLRANNLLIAVRKLISRTNLRMFANKLLILDNHWRSGNYVNTPHKERAKALVVSVPPILLSTTDQVIE
jgi:hypothetical protein